MHLRFSTIHPANREFSQKLNNRCRTACESSAPKDPSPGALLRRRAAERLIVRDLPSGRAQGPYPIRRHIAREITRGQTVGYNPLLPTVAIPPIVLQKSFLIGAQKF